MLIQQGMDKEHRYFYLKKMAVEQLEGLKKLDLIKSIKRQSENTYPQIEGDRKNPSSDDLSGGSANTGKPEKG